MKSLRRRGDPNPVAPDFQADPITSHLAAWVERHPRTVIALGRLESRWYADRLRTIPLDRPIFITGLARGGTTILLEFIASLPGMATHRYRDFPFLHIPIWWNRFLDLAPRRPSAPVERSHRDGILVTPESPEAMEEPLWMTFFPRLHDPTTSHVLDAHTRHEAFEAFYRDHLRKILFLRGGRRYASKGNYNVTRMEYLLRLFPDARFIVPFREPKAHVASLRKQQQLFSENLRNNPAARAHLRRVGHFEFGPDRHPIHTGDDQLQASIRTLWDLGDETRGWARSWAAVYNWVAGRLRDNPTLRQAVMLVSFETLCRHPTETLRLLCRHVEVDDARDIVDQFAQRIAAPRYYQPSFTAEECAVITEETSAALRRLQDIRQAHDAF